MNNYYKEELDKAHKMLFILTNEKDRAISERDQARAELAAERAKVHAAELHAAGMHTQRDEAIRNEARAIKEQEKLREALEWYANPEIYRPDATGRVGDLTFKARAVLKEVGGGDA